MSFSERLFCLLTSGWIYLGLLAQLVAQPVNLPLEFNHIQEAQGLSENVVDCLLQDRDGYLWIGTHKGLNRFDGSHFTVFKNDRRRSGSLGNNIIQDICQDKTGKLWLSTDDGISCYDGHTGQFRNIRSAGGVVFGQCRNILCDRKGRIWFSSSYQGLFRLDPLTDQIVRYKYDPITATSLSGDYISKNGLLEDPHRDGLWMTAKDSGLNYLDITSGQFLNHRNNPEQLPIFQQHKTSALVLEGTDQLIFADNTDQRILAYNLPTKTVTDTIAVTSLSGQPVFPIATIFVDRSHNLWVSSWKYKLFTIGADRQKTQEFFHDVAEKTSIAGDFFWAGWQQNDGTIWFGTVNGISYTNPTRTFYQVHNLAHQYPALALGKGLSSFWEDPDKSWWLSSAENELFNYQPATSRLAVYKLPKAHPDDYRFGLPMIISGLARDELYICLTKSVTVFNKRTRTFVPFALPPMVFNHATDLSAIIRQGDWLWLFGTSDVIFLCHLPTRKWRTYALPFDAGTAKFRIYSVGLDKTGQLLADVALKGYIRFLPKEDRFVRYPSQPNMTNRSDHHAFVADPKKPTLETGIRARSD